MTIKKKSRHHLFIKESYDFFLIGLSSGTKDYQVAWSVNKSLGIHLEKKENFLLKNKKGRESSFPVFEYSDNDGFKYYILIGNHSPNGCFSAEYNKLDFFLLIRDTSMDFQINSIMEKLKTAPLVNLSHLLNPQEIKAKKQFSELIQI